MDTPSLALKGGLNAPVADLAEARQKSDRQVYADWLMRNHFHLVIETPPAQSGGGDELAAGHLSAQFGHPRALGVVAATTRPEPAPCPCGPMSPFCFLLWLPGPCPEQTKMSAGNMTIAFTRLPSRLSHCKKAS